MHNKLRCGEGDEVVNDLRAMKTESESWTTATPIYRDEVDDNAYEYE